MGGFGKGLCRAAGGQGDALDLSGASPFQTGGGLHLLNRRLNSSQNRLSLGRFHAESPHAPTVAAVLAAIVLSNELTSLRLSNRGLGEKSIKVLAEALKSTSTLTQLDLRGNHLGIESSRALAEALKVNTQ